MARGFQWLVLLFLIWIVTFISFAVSSIIEDPVARALFFAIFLFLMIVGVVITFSMIMFVVKGHSYSTYHPRWALSGYMRGHYPIWMYTKHYKEYYDHVGNLDHGREAYEEERRREYSRPEGLIDVSKGKTMLWKRKSLSRQRRTVRPPKTRYAEGLSFCPQCEKPFIPGEEKRCSRCGTKFVNSKNPKQIQ